MPLALAGIVCCCACLADNLLRNPSAEDVADGKPVSWGLYRGKGKASWGVSENAHSGKWAAFVRAEELGRRP